MQSMTTDLANVRREPRRVSENLGVGIINSCLERVRPTYQNFTGHRVRVPGISRVVQRLGRCEAYLIYLKLTSRIYIDQLLAYGKVGGLRTGRNKCIE